MAKKATSKTTNPYNYRLEVRLHRNNNEYLHIDNLHGSVDDVIKRHVPLLSVIVHNHLSGNIEVSGTHNKHFNRIFITAGNEGKGKRRYRNGKLRKSEPAINIPKKSDTVGLMEMEREQKRLIDTFYREMEDAQNAIEMGNNGERKRLEVAKFR